MMLVYDYKLSLLKNDFKSHMSDIMLEFVS
jgi:hypothetical protein